MGVVIGGGGVADSKPRLSQQCGGKKDGQPVAPNGAHGLWIHRKKKGGDGVWVVVVAL